MGERKPKFQWDMTKTLIAAAAALAVVLIVVICIAIGLPGGGNESPAGGEQTGGSTISQPTDSTGYLGLSVKPLSQKTATIEEKAVFEGISDPNEPVTVNGTAVKQEKDGSFVCEVPLVLGENEIVFSHKGETAKFSIQRRYTVEWYSPVEDQSYNSGATIRFAVSARSGSQVTAAFNGEQIALEVADDQHGNDIAEGFALYVGEYRLSGTNTSDLQLGAITYTAVCDGVTETYTSGNITCLKAADILASDPSVTPSYGDYIDVGSGYIAEIVINTAETFDGDKTDNYSHPTNNYLPKGTVDYCSTELVSNGNHQYVKLRCGRRVYVQKRNYPPSRQVQVSERYAGTLPDHNEISVVSMSHVGNHTVLTLDCLWKAPFYFDLKPQNYANPDLGADRSYEVTACTATYIDITFCYATQFAGTVQIPAGNPLFESAELIKRESDCTLRLHLKKTGGFYGWDCHYNDKDQLVFTFLNPAKVTAGENAYGADLTGTTIMIDVGHGGSDPGTVGYLTDGTMVKESHRNLALATQLKAELESMGAKVVMNRAVDETVSVDERINLLKATAPDLCVSIHHNAIDKHPDFGGFECFYFTPWSKLVTERVYRNTKDSGVYTQHAMRWHTFFAAQQTCCPVVLAENGYMTNQYDLNNTLSEASIAKKAGALAQSVADYFLAINQ